MGCALVMMVFILFVRALKRRTQKNTLTKSVGTKTCEYIISGSICCANLQKHDDDEGYNSCTSDQDYSSQATPASSTLSGGSHEMTLSRKIDEMLEDTVGERTDSKLKRKTRNMNYPIPMTETEIPDVSLDKLVCISASSTASNNRMPGTVTHETTA